MTSFFVAAHGWIEKDGAFLVTRRSVGNDYMPGTWDVPGGTIEAGETVEQGLIREVKEERGARRTSLGVGGGADASDDRVSYGLSFHS